MNHVDLTPYWSATDDWAGFLLFIIPAGQLSVSPEELRLRVRRQIEADAVLYDLVTVALAPAFEPTREWNDALLTSVVEAAMPDRHFFAPRGLIGIVVVSDRADEMESAVQGVKAMTTLRHLGVRLFRAGIPADRRNAVAPASVQRIASVATMLIETYELEPSAAIAEPQFLAHVGYLLEHESLALPGLIPEPTLEEFSAPPTRLTDKDFAGPSALTPAPGVYGSASISVPTPAPAQGLMRAPALPPATPAPSRPPLVEPVVYDGAEIVVVDQRTPKERLLRQHRTDAHTMDELTRDGRSVGLVCLVFVPDDGAVTRAVAKNRNTITVALDQLLSSVEIDALTGERAHTVVEILSATNPVRKHGVLREAGHLTESMLPNAPIEYFDFQEVVDPLIDVAARTTRAIQARGLGMASVHFVFVATIRFPADEATEDDWMRLLDHGRVTWIDFGSSQRQQVHQMPPSPFGLHVLTDKEDVVAVIKKQSEILYRYATPPPLPSPASVARQLAFRDGSATEPTVQSRRWWPFKKESQRP